MSTFLYQSVDQHGRYRTGELQASDRQSAFSMLRRDGLTPLSLEIKGSISKRGAGSTLISLIALRRISAVDKMLLTRHLSAVVKSGLPIREALDILQEDAKKPALKQILADAKYGLERGQPLSVAFEMYPQFFSPVFVGLVRAGEKSGTLEDTLATLGEQLMRDNELLKRVRAALVYPAILFVASVGVILLLLMFLLPRLAAVFASTRTELPAITKFFVWMSGILTAMPAVTLGLLALIGVGGVAVFRLPFGRRVAVRIMHRMPFMHGLLKGLALARFTRTLHGLLKSGISILDALDITAKSVGNVMYTEALFAMREEATRGISIADALRSRSKLFPRLLVSMVTVGERTGTLDASLNTLASFYDEEVDRNLKGLVGVLEPALLLVMGIVVGGVALSVLLPIYQIVGSIR